MGRCGIWRKDQFSLDRMIKRFKSSRFRDVGAVTCFLGVVRGLTHQGEDVERLEMEAYEEVAEEALNKISEEVEKKYGVSEVSIHHVIGKLEVGNLIMAILVAGSSREEVLPALKETVERTKAEAAIWKKEVLKDGRSYWVEYHEMQA